MTNDGQSAEPQRAAYLEVPLWAGLLAGFNALWVIVGLAITFSGNPWIGLTILPGLLVWLLAPGVMLAVTAIAAAVVVGAAVLKRRLDGGRLAVWVFSYGAVAMTLLLVAGVVLGLSGVI